MFNKIINLQSENNWLVAATEYWRFPLNDLFEIANKKKSTSVQCWYSFLKMKLIQLYLSPGHYDFCFWTSRHLDIRFVRRHFPFHAELTSSLKPIDVYLWIKPAFVDANIDGTLWVCQQQRAVNCKPHCSEPYEVRQWLTLKPMGLGYICRLCVFIYMPGTILHV